MKKKSKGKKAGVFAMYCSHPGDSCKLTRARFYQQCCYYEFLIFHCVCVCVCMCVCGDR